MAEALPIDGLLPELMDAVEERRASVLQAPPGTGKTTRLPPALLERVQGAVWVLEPRRIAARGAARRVARERGSAIGAEVGYAVRGEARRSAQTRLLYVTVGVFLRAVVDDPFLEGIGAVVVDEFHERSVEMDLAIALLRAVQRELRDDLAVVVMSATLDAEPVAAFLDAPVHTAETRRFPVEISYDPRPDPRPLEDRVAEAVRGLRGHHDLLVFLPGVAEIRKVAAQIPGALELHGRVGLERQDAVLRRSSGGRVILATNVAESAVTVPGVRAVVDSGLVRELWQDRSTGLDRLELRPIAVDAAEQRAGRAGREGPGKVRRLWTARAHRARPATTVPAVRRVDLAAAVLQLYAFGEPDPIAFTWFERPEDAAIERAVTLLEVLGAVRHGRLTELGERLARLPLHPRLGCFVLEAERRGAGRRAADLALWIADGARPEGELADLNPPHHPRAERLARSARPEPDALERAALVAWPDRLAKRRGEGAVGAGGIGLVGCAHPLFVAVGVHPTWRGPRGERRVTLYSRVEPDWLRSSTRKVHRWDGTRVRAWCQRRVGELVVDEQPAPVDPAIARSLLFERASADLDRALPDDPELDELLGRLAFLARYAPHPDLPDGTATDTLLPVLEQLCEGRSRLKELQRAPWRQMLLDGLCWDARQHLERHAPTRVVLASGRRAKLRYAGEDRPVLAVRIQELFGTRSTPRVAGRPVLLHLLAPNGRPQQITDDLEGFWRNTYFDVRRDLRRRYPKHPWPDDPLVVPPDRIRSRREGR